MEFRRVLFRSGLGKLEAPADVPEHVADTVEQVVDQRQREAEEHDLAQRRSQAGRGGRIDIAAGGCGEQPPRPAERRVGKEWVSTCSSRWSPNPEQKKPLYTNAD